MEPFHLAEPQPYYPDLASGGQNIWRQSSRQLIDNQQSLTLSSRFKNLATLPWCSESSIRKSANRVSFVIRLRLMFISGGDGF